MMLACATGDLCNGQVVKKFGGKSCISFEAGFTLNLSNISGEATSNYYSTAIKDNFDTTADRQMKEGLVFISFD